MIFGNVGFKANEEKFFHAHAPETYYSWLRGISPRYLLRSGDKDLPRGLFARIACPVDVEIYNSEGMLVGRTIDNVPDETRPFEGVSVYVNEEEKYVYLSPFDSYTFRLTGTGSGEMALTIEEMDMITGETYGGKDFAHVLIHEGKQMEFMLGGGFSSIDVNLFVIESGAIVAEVLPDGTEIPVGAVALPGVTDTPAAAPNTDQPANNASPQNPSSEALDTFPSPGETGDSGINKALIVIIAVGTIVCIAVIITIVALRKKKAGK